MSNTFRCAECGKTFKKARTDKEALEDLNKEFPDMPVSECVVVCENCYQVLVDHFTLNHYSP